MKRRRLILLIAVVSLSLALVPLLWRRSGISLGQAPEPEADASESEAFPTVVTVLPRVGDVEQVLRLPGSLEPFEIAELQAKVTGFLEEIHVDIGDEVGKGALLARLSIPEMAPELETARAELAAARARLEKAEADAELASVTHARVGELQSSEPGAISKQDVDVAAAEAKVARAATRVAQAEVELAKSRIARLEAITAYAEIRAPFDGVVTRRFAHRGALMGGGDPASQAIVEVVRTDKLRLAVDIPEVAVPHVAEGHEVEIVVDALPAESFTGRVSRLSGALEPRTRNRRVEIDLESYANKLLPGMYATVRLDLRSFENSVALPAKAIQKADGHTYVYTVLDGTVARCPLAILLDDGEEVVVTGDLGARTPVIVSMPRLLGSGDEVQSRPTTLDAQ